MLARIVFVPVLALAGLAALSSISAAGGGCHAATTATTSRGTAVEIKNCGFSPTILQVPVGGTVTFTNADYLPHVVSGVGWGSPSIDGGTLASGQSQSQRFPEAGVYPYTCYLHPGMSGAVIVGDATTAGAPAGAPLAVAPAPSVAPTPVPEQRSDNPFSGSALLLGTAGFAGVLGYAIARRRPAA